MPQAIPAAAAFITQALVTVGVGVQTAATIGSIAATAAATAVLVASSAMMRPDVDRAGSPTQWQADPNAGIPFAMGGRQGIGGRIVFRHEFSPDVENMYLGLVTVWSGAGPVKGLEDYLVAGEAQSFGVDHMTTGSYGDKLYMSYQLGEQPEASALASPTILRSGVTIEDVGWTADHKLSGKAADMTTLGHDDVGDVYPGGAEPEIMRVLEGGVVLYDPRNDDTQTAIGGEGDERWDDRDTWGYPTNPIIGALNWALGLYENGKRVGGMGIPMDALLLDQFADAANIADLNGWTFAAYPTTVDDKWQVFLALLQAGGAMPCTVNGKLGCWSRGATKTSLLTVTEDDLAGPIELNLSTSRLDRINTIIPSCRLESAQWDMAALAEPITFSDLVTEDGGQRSREVRYNYVTDPDQCAELAALDILDAREAISGIIPCKPYLRDLRAGDAFTLDLDIRGLESLKCVVLRRPDFDVEQGICRIAFRQETDGKYALALGSTGVEPEPVDPPTRPVVPTPPDTDWTVTGGGRTGPGGGVIPALSVAGTAGNSPNVSKIVVEVVEDGTDSFIPAGEGLKDTTAFDVRALAPDTDYEVFISYYDAGGRGPGPRTSLGTYNSGPLVTGTAPSLAAYSTPPSRSKAAAAGSVTSGAFVISVSGGTPGYTYAWTKVSGDTLTVNSPTGSSTTFSTTLSAGQNTVSVYRCTVTDSLAATTTVDVTITFQEIS